MRYIMAAIAGLTILAFSSSVFADDHTWQRPTECADEDREVRGNRSTPCKYVLPVLENVEYDVRMVYPSCWELLIFRMPGVKPLPDDFSIFRISAAIQRFRGDSRDSGGKGLWRAGDSRRISVHIDRIASWGYGWGLGDAVNRSAFPNPLTDHPYVRIRLSNGGEWVGEWSNAVLYPDTTNTVELVNACLTPNPPKDTDGRREGSGRGWVRELQGRWPGVLG